MRGTNRPHDDCTGLAAVNFTGVSTGDRLCQLPAKLFVIV